MEGNVLSQCLLTLYLILKTYTLCGKKQQMLFPGLGRKWDPFWPSKNLKIDAFTMMKKCKCMWNQRYYLDKLNYFISSQHNYFLDADRIKGSC